MKNIINKIMYFCVLLSFSAGLSLFAGESSIPLEKDLILPSDDLIYEGNRLSSRDADQLSKKQKVDLSKLDPKGDDIWGHAITPINDQVEIAIESNDILTYEGKILSNSGLYRFNAIPVNGNRKYTIHLDKTLHSMLLRKNLLRVLGYKIPAMKFLKNAKIQFSSKEAINEFLKSEIPGATMGAAERWLVGNVDNDNLIVTLRDVAVTESSELDFYNVSMGIPTQTINSRSLRALVIPFTLVDLYESVNKFSWINGKVDNKAVVLGHFTNNRFATTVDDAVWMIRKLNKLTRADFQKIVSEAYFPKDAEKLIVEKLLSRRNSLNRAFSLKVEEIPFDAKITSAPGLKEGKLSKVDYQDYASRFAYGDAESPFDQLKYYLYSKIQSNFIDNVISKINSEMSVYDSGEKRLEYFQKQFLEGLDHYVKTGEFLPIKVGTWYSPVVDFQVLLSRDIILGNYLGTNNMVQMADTFGAGVDLGVQVGVEGLGYDLAGSIKAGASLVRSYSHLRPVKNLKASLKEPYRNILVPLLKKSLKEDFLSLSELKNAEIADATETQKNDQKKKIEEMLKEIDKGLEVGESLIITDRIVPSASVRLNFNQGMVGAGIGVSGGLTWVLSRIHIFKKSAKVLQIYDDTGTVKNLDLSFHVSNFIPILKLNATYDKGHYYVDSYMVNLSSDTTENPNLFSNALGVYNVLKGKDFEVLGANNPPVKLDVRFKDKGKNLSLLFWKMKSLTGKTYYDIKAKDGVEGTYFSLEKDFLTGLNPEVFSKQVINYYISQETDDVQISEEAGANPGESFFGRSRTQKLRFEASLDENKKFDQKFLSLSDIKQGWGMSEKKMKKFMKEVNDKFQSPLFNPGQIDFKKLRLFNVGYHMNLYNRGIERLYSITRDEINVLESKYKKTTRKCLSTDERLNTAKCGNLKWIKIAIKNCEKAKDQEGIAECGVDLFEQLMDDLDFKDFQTLIGENNLYVYGSIDGFREKSEVLNDTIFSNSIGKIGSKQWNGPLEIVRDLLGLSGGEFGGGWIREGI